MAERSPLHDSSVLMRPPAHPVSQLQGPFEESMLESVNDEQEPDQFLDPISRRNMLLESPTYVRVVAGRWKQKPGEKFHPLWKLIAQISFGVHLLAANMAKSEEEVMEILQSHVDEIDGFLERTTEDLDLALEDIRERLRCLKLPLRHPEVFDRMLEDRSFRNSIVEGNEKIEHIVDRTSKNMKDSLKDVQKGFDSTTCLERYLHGLSDVWQRDTAEHEAVFVAMIGNVEGWRKAFMDLHLQGNKLGGYLRRLTEIINEMQQRAGEVSRRLLHQAQGFNKDRSSKSQQPQTTTKPSTRQTPISRFRSGSQGQAQKGLPTAPAKPAHTRQGSSKASSLRSETPQIVHIGSRNQSVDKLPSQSRTLSPQLVQNTHSPQVVEGLQPGSMRIRSMIPTVVDETSSDKEVISKSESNPINERNFIPVELPAHVPEETLRAAPMSKANRLSMGLGILPSDRKMKTSSRTYSPTAALIDLLRASPKPGGMPLTPQSMNSAQGTPSPSGQVGKETSENGSEYFSIKADRSPGAASPQPPSSLGKSSIQTASTVTPAAAKQRAELKRGAFSSHPPDLPPGSPPVQQGASPAPLHIEDSPKEVSTETNTDDGTLGEPGPSEVAGSASGSVSELTSTRMMPPYPRNPKRVSAFAPELVTFETQPKRKHAEAYQGDIVKQKPRAFIAEMEGSSPNLLENQGLESPVVVELEAPRQHFTLPPRPTATTSKPESKANVSPAPGVASKIAVPKSSTAEESDITHPKSESQPTTETSPEIVPKDVAVTNENVFNIAQRVPLPESPMPQSPREAASHIARKEPKLSTLSQDTTDPSDVSKADPVQDMIEKLSGSPSETPDNAAEALEERRSSRVLSPNHTAPAPPGPGGPKMVDGNNADAGQFYGERKQPHVRTGSSSSQTGQIGWKAFFKGQPSPVGSNLSVRSIKRTSTDQKSVPDQKSPTTPSTNTPMASPRLAMQKSSESMMTGEGKDILWFSKQDGMERVAMNAAQKNQKQQQEKPSTPQGPVEMDAS